MNVEQIAIRQEVRQMLNEAGINKNTLKDMVKSCKKKYLRLADRLLMKVMLTVLSQEKSMIILEKS